LELIKGETVPVVICREGRVLDFTALVNVYYGIVLVNYYCAITGLELVMVCGVTVFPIYCYD